MLAGTAKNQKCYPVHTIASQLSPDILANMPGFHALTGCDTTSSFTGLSKKTCWKVFTQHPALLDSVGRDGNINGPEEFVCRLYGGERLNESKDINSLRFALFQKAQKALEALPPTKDALIHHFARCNYQAKIWLDADKQHSDAGNATDTGGWCAGEKGPVVVWTTLPSVPKACVELTTCGCKTKCSTARCSCYRLQQPCMFECACNMSGCANPISVAHDHY